MLAMYGSTVCLFMTTDHVRADPNIWTYTGYRPDRIGVAMCTATSGSVTKWFRDCFGGDLAEGAYDQLTEEASHSPPGARGLILLPYFSGERSPIYNPDAKGLLFGLTLGHSRGDVFRAIVEGIGYSIRDNLEAIGALGLFAKKLVAVGGGVKNSVWLQAVSDICGLHQYVPEITLGASYGDAFLAGVGAGIFNRVEDIAEWVHYRTVVAPDPGNRTVYDTGEKHLLLKQELSEEVGVTCGFHHFLTDTQSSH